MKKRRLSLLATGCTLALTALLCGCDDSKQALSLALEKSFKDYQIALDKVDEQLLQNSVLLPHVPSYKDHVVQLRFGYLERLQREEPVVFDQQGIVLSRFLGLNYHRYTIEKLHQNETETQAEMRIAVYFAYDNNIKFSDFEKNTRIFIPAKPWGTAHTILVGGDDNPVPREQLKYVEIDLVFQRTETGHWQVATCKADKTTAQFEISLETH